VLVHVQYTLHTFIYNAPFEIIQNFLAGKEDLPQGVGKTGYRAVTAIIHLVTETWSKTYFQQDIKVYIAAIQMQGFIAANN
jgi:hypothetical protein